MSNEDHLSMFLDSFYFCIRYSVFIRICNEVIVLQIDSLKAEVEILKQQVTQSADMNADQMDNHNTEGLFVQLFLLFIIWYLVDKYSQFSFSSALVVLSKCSN